MSEAILPPEDNRPKLTPTQETWIFCEEIGREKNLTPKEVLSKLTALGETIVKLHRLGIPVVAKNGDREIDLDIFDK